MAEKKKTEGEELVKSDSRTVLLPYEVTSQPPNVCDMCGHLNPSGVAICKMCSNYLKGMK